MRYFAPDTNVLLHFKLFTDITADDFDGPLPDKWLFVAQVVREVDKLKSHRDNYLGGRARAVSRKLNDSAVVARLELFLDTSLVDYGARGQTALPPDECIIAELRTFRDSHQDDEIVVITADTVMRHFAAANGFTILAPPESLRRKPEQQSEREIRELRTRIAELEGAAPQLVVASPSGTKEWTVQVGPVLTEDMLNHFMDQIQPEPAHVYPSAILQVGFVPTPDFDNLWNAYVPQMRDYIRMRHHREYRTVPIQLQLRNDGNVSAHDIHITLRIHVSGEVSNKQIPKPTRPQKPGPFRDVYSSGLTRAWAAVRPFSVPLAPRGLLSAREQRRTGPYVTAVPGAAIVRYWEKSLLQKDTSALEPFFVSFQHDDPPSRMTIAYEIRARNAVGVAKGQILVTCLVVDVNLGSLLIPDDGPG